MNSDEKIAQAFLGGPQAVRFEPSGQSKYPDFVDYSGVAIEIRRLTEVAGSGDTSVGLPNLGQPLWDALIKKAPRAPSIASRGSFRVVATIKRPFDGSGLKERVDRLYRDLLQQYRQTSKARLEARDGSLVLTAEQMNETLPEALIFSLLDDHDSGGFINGVYEAAIRYAISEKARKRDACECAYSGHRLILIDHVRYATAQTDWPSIQVDREGFMSVDILDTEGNLLASY